MGDMSSMSRESKKQQLRRQMITPGKDFPSGRSQMEEQELYAARQKKRRRNLMMAGLVLVLVFVFAGGWFYYQQIFRFTEYETIRQISLSQGSLVGYETFGKNVIKYTRDGASYVDNRGAAVWNDSYEMKLPIVSVNGDYAAIADQQGNKIYIYNTSGKVGEATTILPITKVAVSGLGFVAVVVEGPASSYLYCFTKDGSPHGTEMKANISGNGYMMDISVSKDGTQMMASYVYLKGGQAKSRVVFYDFSEVGKNQATRLVGGFDEPFENVIVPRVVYLKEPYSCAFGSTGPVFFSSKNLLKPEMLSQVLLEEEIQGIFYSDEYVGVVVWNNTNEGERRLEVYRADGKHVLSKEFTYDYTHADIDGELIFLYNDNSCRIYNMAGVEKLDAVFDFAVTKIRRGSAPNTLLVIGPQEMREIKLK